MWEQIKTIAEIDIVQDDILLSPGNPEYGGGEPIYSVQKRTDDHIVLNLVVTGMEDRFDEAQERINNKKIKPVDLFDEGWWMTKIATG